LLGILVNGDEHIDIHGIKVDEKFLSELAELKVLIDWEGLREDDHLREMLKNRAAILRLVEAKRDDAKDALEKAFYTECAKEVHHMLKSQQNERPSIKSILNAFLRLAVVTHETEAAIKRRLDHVRTEIAK
jgi:hypothetical protein